MLSVRPLLMHRLAAEPFRVAIGTPDGEQSSFWRFWVSASEVYLSAATIGGVFKVSLHSGGQCIAAFTNEQVRLMGGEAALAGGSRRVLSWRRGPGAVVIPFQLEFPANELRAGAAGIAPAKAHSWLEPPPPDYSRSLFVAFRTTCDPDLAWPPVIDGTAPLSADDLPNGDGVAILTSVHRTSSEVVGAISDKRGRIPKVAAVAAGKPIDRSSPTSRFIVTGTSGDGRRIFLEAALSAQVAV